jgi:hypothetical protein
MKRKLAIGIFGLGLLLTGSTVDAASGVSVKDYCKPVQGYEQIIEHFNSITQGFNDKNWGLIEPFTDKDISLTRIEEKTKKTHKKTKDKYKDHLENDAWKRNPAWSNVTCDVNDVTNELVKLVATYDFTFDKPPSGSKTTVPSFAVMLFTRNNGAMIDFTVGTLQK